MDLNSYLKKNHRLVDGFLKSYISSTRRNNSCPKTLHRSMGYSLMAGGKRLRPIFAIAGHEAVGGRAGNIIPIAASLELIHTYSLIHDDLPAMDDDDLRRNMPTNHKVFGEATAILAGDALLTDAFSIVSNANAKPDALLNIIRELTYACGPHGMVGGQTADILLEGKKAKKSELLYIHTHKTGALIRASVRIGAILGVASQKELNALSKYGENVGLAFQIVDDILDITGTDEELGKSAGADILRGKNTYPSVFGMETSKEEAKILIEKALDAIGDLNSKADPLREIAKYILRRRN
ncbi:MAG: polyprenyl synthetase family protein [Nitrospirae bacterium]|nr:polyprenyl synthetase family protein [Nitrospirota bacterium]